MEVIDILSLVIEIQHVFLNISKERK